MNPTIKVIQRHRRYSEDYKRSLVKEFERGIYSVQQLSRLHGIRQQVIYNWIYKFSTFNSKSSQIVEMKDSSSAKLKALEEKVRELERAVGRKQIQIDYLEKMIDLAKDELDIDIKKNYGTSQSGGSENTGSK